MCEFYSAEEKSKRGGRVLSKRRLTRKSFDPSDVTTDISLLLLLLLLLLCCCCRCCCYCCCYRRRIDSKRASSSNARQSRRNPPHLVPPHPTPTHPASSHLTPTPSHRTPIRMAFLVPPTNTKNGIVRQTATCAKLPHAPRATGGYANSVSKICTSTLYEKLERSFPTVGTSARLVVVSLFLSSVVFFLISCDLFFLSRFCVSVLFLIMYRPSFLLLSFVYFFNFYTVVYPLLFLGVRTLTYQTLLYILEKNYFISWVPYFFSPAPRAWLSSA